MLSCGLFWLHYISIILNRFAALSIVTEEMDNIMVLRVDKDYVAETIEIKVMGNAGMEVKSKIVGVFCGKCEKLSIDKCNDRHGCHFCIFSSIIVFVECRLI